jgi:hypothetical protein
VEHARLASELARVWGNDCFPAFAAFPSLLWAVEHHDDGWKEWDDAPRLHPDTGIPRSFMEMRMRDSTAIWTKSIAYCSSDPLAAIAVSRHFCHLAMQVQRSEREDADDVDAIHRFLQEQATAEAGLMQNSGSNNAALQMNGELAQICDLGFRTVRFFDAVSLWLCCAERHESQHLVAPMGRAVQLIPQSPSYISIEPYPLSVDSLRLETPGRRLTARPFPNDKELQTALRAAPLETQAWTIGPN